MGTRRGRHALNPFRQQDEDEVLKMRSFNRRRWSHVFPLGEVEFKRHAGPNWKSLTAPAILPLGVDYFPTPDDLSTNFGFGIHSVTHKEFRNKNFKTHIALLDEMVRQRISQDFQLVSPDCKDLENFRLQMRRSNGATAEDAPGMVRHFLSIGHRLQVLTYNPHSDLVEVSRYNSKQAQQNDPMVYYYHCFCEETRKFRKVRQPFKKYTDEYQWNRVDRLICGTEDRELREEMRFRRLMFGLIPDDWADDEAMESEYCAKFKRLLDYFDKQRIRDDTMPELNVKIATKGNREPPDECCRTFSAPGLSRESMTRFYIQLRKGERENFEWMEVTIDSTFDTTWSYRIIFGWLVASSVRIDAQVQLLQRRCNTYGLKLVYFPQVTTSENMFLQPFKAPVILTLRNKEYSKLLDRTLSEKDFIHDGVFPTDIAPILECIERKQDFSFGKPSRGKPWIVLGRQFVHRSATIFVRAIADKQDLTILVVLGNYRYIASAKDRALEKQYRDAFQALLGCVEAVKSQGESLSDGNVPKPEPHPSLLVASAVARPSSETSSPRLDKDAQSSLTDPEDRTSS